MGKTWLHVLIQLRDKLEKDVQSLLGSFVITPIINKGVQFGIERGTDCLVVIKELVNRWKTINGIIDKY